MVAKGGVKKSFSPPVPRVRGDKRGGGQGEGRQNGRWTDGRMDDIVFILDG